MHVPHYPLFVSLEQRVCLVVGGGAVGERKIRGLLQSGACIRLVAHDLTPWLVEQQAAGHIHGIGDSYRETCLDGVDLVFAATSDKTLNRRIAKDARERKIWCNMATDPDEGTFIVPAVFQQGPLTIAVSTGGSSPAAARLIRERLQTEFGPEWVLALHFMGVLRTVIQSRGLKSSQNQSIFREIARLPLADWIKGKQHDAIIQSIYEICQPWLTLDELNQLWDKSWKQSSSSLPPCATAVEPSDT